MVLLPLLVAGMLGGQGPQGVRAEAERLARAGSYEQALERFRELAAANPDDLDARVWIGRLHVSMGHAEAAVPVFRSVLDTAPERVDALMGLGGALTTLGETAEAIEVLNRAEKLAPDDPEVLAAQGRAHRSAGHLRLAEAYLNRAAVLRTEDRTIARSLEGVRRDTAHTVSATYMNESYNVDVTDTRFGSLAVSLRANDRLRVTGRIDVQRKFGLDEARGGGGLVVNALPNVTVEGSALFGGSADVLPRGDVNVAVSVAHRGAVWSGALRFVRFGGADYRVFSPGFTVTLENRAIVFVGYSRSQTVFDRFQDNISNDSGDVRLQMRVVPKFWVGGGYTRNVSAFDVLSPDRLGAFRANTASANGRLELGSRTLGIDYDYQRRDNGVRLVRIIGSVVQRF